MPGVVPSSGDMVVVNDVWHHVTEGHISTAANAMDERNSLLIGISLYFVIWMLTDQLL